MGGSNRRILKRGTWSSTVVYGYAPRTLSRFSFYKLFHEDKNCISVWFGNWNLNLPTHAIIAFWSFPRFKLTMYHCIYGLPEGMLNDYIYWCTCLSQCMVLKLKLALNLLILQVVHQQGCPRQLISNVITVLRVVMHRYKYCGMIGGARLIMPSHKNIAESISF